MTTTLTYDRIPQEKLLEYANSLAGRVALVYYNRPVETKKKGRLANATVEKHSVFKVRVGIEYNNQAKVIEKHESGQVENKGLPESMEKIDRVHYYHKYNGNVFMGCTPNGSKTDKVETTWYVDGIETNLDDIKDDILKKEWASDHSNRDWMYLNISRVVSISGLE